MKEAKTCKTKVTSPYLPQDFKHGCWVTHSHWELRLPKFCKLPVPAEEERLWMNNARGRACTRRLCTSLIYSNCSYKRTTYCAQEMGKWRHLLLEISGLLKHVLFHLVLSQASKQVSNDYVFLQAQVLRHQTDGSKTQLRAKWNCCCYLSRKTKFIFLSYNVLMQPYSGISGCERQKNKKWIHFYNAAFPIIFGVQVCQERGVPSQERHQQVVGETSATSAGSCGAKSRHGLSGKNGNRAVNLHVWWKIHWRIRMCVLRFWSTDSLYSLLLSSINPNYNEVDIQLLVHKIQNWQHANIY